MTQDDDDDTIEAVIMAMKAGTTWRHGTSRYWSTWRVDPSGPAADGTSRFIEDHFDEGLSRTISRTEAQLRDEVRLLLPQARQILPKPPRR